MQSPPGAADTVSLIVNGQSWTGWQRVAVTRNMDTMPASFAIQVTEKYPLSPDMIFAPGEPCEVMIGSDLVITGYVDRYNTIIQADNHTVRIEGRSKSADLVDCAGFFGTADNPAYQWPGGPALALIQALAAQYGVTVNSTAAGASTDILPFVINLGETAWEIIDRICRFSQVIAYDLPDGSVILADSNSPGSMASGFAQGINIEQANANYSMDQRFSIYEPHIISSVFFNDQQGLAATNWGDVTDAGVPRFRKRIIISEQVQGSHFLAHDRAQWEANRRAARSQAVVVRCDAWRDQAGTLWDLNHQAPLDLPAIKITNSTTSFLIAAVTYMRDETGQHALVTLMPPGAFAPEPIGNLNLPPLLTDLQRYNPTAPDPGRF